MTLPEHERGSWATGPESVTALAVSGEDRILELPPGMARVTVGSGEDQDVRISSPYVSRHHGVIERRGVRTYFVTSDAAKNGTVFRERLEKECEIKPGDSLLLGGRVRVVVLNEAQKLYLPTIAQIVCRESEHTEKGGADRLPPLAVLALSLDPGPILVTGEAGCEHERLAHAIHAISSRRERRLVHLAALPEKRKAQREIIDAAERSTLIVTITDKTAPLDPAFVSMLLSPSYHIRVIALAATKQRAGEVLGRDNAERMTEIYLQPIGFRPTVIPWLLDEMLRERGSTLRVSDFTDANLAALQDYDWRGNFPELREAVDLFILLDKGSQRAVAAQLGVGRATVYDWAKARGITLPLTRRNRTVEHATA